MKTILSYTCADFSYNLPNQIVIMRFGNADIIKFTDFRFEICRHIVD